MVALAKDGDDKSRARALDLSRRARSRRLKLAIEVGPAKDLNGDVMREVITDGGSSPRCPVIDDEGARHGYAVIGGDLLHLAISRKHAGAVRALLDDALAGHADAPVPRALPAHQKTTPRPPMPPGTPPPPLVPRRVAPYLYMAAWDDDTPTGEVLVAVLRAVNDIDLVARNQDDETCLMAAAHSRTLPVAAFALLCDRYLAAEGGDINAVCMSSASALSKACTRGNTDKARELISRGAALDTQNVEGRTALMKAAANGDLATAAVLLEAGADANVTIRWEHDPDPELSFAGFTAADDAALHLTGAAAAEMEALLAKHGGKPANRQHPIILRNRTASRERDTQDAAMQAMMGEMMGRSTIRRYGHYGDDERDIIAGHGRPVLSSKRGARSGHSFTPAPRRWHGWENSRSPVPCGYGGDGRGEIGSVSACR